MSFQPGGWSPQELSIIDEARKKLDRKARNNVLIGVGGFIATIASFAVMDNGGGIFFYGAMIAGPILAIQARNRRDRLDELVPGTPLNKSTLGIATSADPPQKNSRVAMIILAVLIVLIGGFVIISLASA